jgi:hypothetical protein
MAYTYHGTQGWVKQPNRIVKTFDSGLCLIQQDYIRRKDKVEYFTFKEGDALSVADSQPCIDGAFIFPDPQWRDQGNGFIEVSISAYGRSNTVGKTEISALIRTSTVFQGSAISTLQVLASYLKIKIVVQSGVFPEINLNDLKELITIRNIDGTEIKINNAATTIIGFALFITRYDITNYGFWDELTITVEPLVISISAT